MDNIWERSVPFFRISPTDLTEIFHQYDPGLTVQSYQEVNAGCRNSNYIVNTTRGAYFLRFCPPAESGYLNEKIIFGALYPKINIPRLYFASEFKGREYLIYEYLEAVPLQSCLLGNTRLKNEIVSQVARSAAVIHNQPADNFTGLTQIETPPYEEWYDLFLDNPRAAARIGSETVKRVRQLISHSGPELSQINSYQSFIHRDFRPANMLIAPQNVLFIVDWEFPGAGHTLADIGQFFRYRGCFDEEHLAVFEAEYNKQAIVHLPSDWFELSCLRDLVNPLQMIGAEADLPLKYQDLKNLIRDTLEYFGY